jgi:endoglucanase
MNKILSFSLYLILVSASIIKTQVFINQAGYISSLPKYFYTNTESDSFYVIATGTSEIVYKDELLFSVSEDPATGMTLYWGDFSSLLVQGNYYIRVGSIDSSFSFNISLNALDDAYKKSLKGYYYQRCGITLTPPFAGVYYHPSCHLSDATFHSSTGEIGVKITTGGWHDAGDYGKYVVNSGITVGTLLMAYEMFPGNFSQDDLNIPESGNFVPDILDEIRYELVWLLKMQNSNGGVYFKVTKENFESIVLPNNDSGTRYIYTISSTATADFAAVMARASRIYKSFDPDFANQCKDASILAWNYLSSHPAVVPTGGFKNPEGTYTGEYGDSNDSDERLWAAAELYETTGNSGYKNYFELNYSSNGIINSTMSWPNVKDLAEITYLTSSQDLASSTIKTQIKNSMVNYCNGLVNRAASNGFGVTINPGEYRWGSNSNILNNAVLLILAYEQTKNINYYEVALMQLNYILGINAHNLSFITGVGSKSVLHPHHRPSWADSNINPVPGLLAGGPDQYLDDDVLKSNFSSLTPPALCYVDNVESYASNEIAINWNAPLVFVLGYFNGEGLTNVDGQNFNNMPDQFFLYQNYPNPFNSGTTIKFEINSKQLITLKVFDLLGHEVVTLLQEEKPSGVYNLNFNISNFNLSSGVYFYKLQAGNHFNVKKMIYLK